MSRNDWQIAGFSVDPKDDRKVLKGGALWGSPPWASDSLLEVMKVAIAALDLLDEAKVPNPEWTKQRGELLESCLKEQINDGNRGQDVLVRLSNLEEGIATIIKTLPDYVRFAGFSADLLQTFSTFHRE